MKSALERLNEDYTKISKSTLKRKEEMVYSACHVAVLKVVASRAFCPDVRGRTSMLMGSFHNMFTIGHGISVQKVVALQNKEAKLLHKCPYLWPNSRYLLFALSPDRQFETTPTKLSNTVVVHYSSTGKKTLFGRVENKDNDYPITFPTFEWMSHYTTRKLVVLDSATRGHMP